MVRATLLTAVLAVAAQAQAAPGMLRLSLPAELTCPKPDELIGVFQARFGADKVAVGSQGADELGLELRLSAGVLEIDLTEEPAAPPIQRRLPLEGGSCRDVAEAVALLADAWIRELPWHGVGFLPDLAEASASKATAEIARPPPSAPPPPPVQGWRGPLTLRLAGGGLLAADGSSLVADGEVAVELGLFRRWGIGLGAFLSSDVVEAAQSSAGSVTIHRQALSLAGRYAFAEQSESGLRLSVGGEILRYGIDLSEVAFTSDHLTTYGPAAFAAAAWEQHVWKFLSLFAEATVTLAQPLSVQAVEVDSQSRAAASLPAVFIGLEAGVSFRLL